MSLLPVAERIEAQPSPHPDRPASLALIFLLDAPYLDALRIFAHSLAATGSFIADPLIVMSPDRNVLSDPFVRRICDLPVHIGPGEIARFAGIRAGLIEERFRLPWIAKFTFLKWLAYGDFGFDWHLIFDADMLALRNLEAVTAMRGESQFICCPKFPARPVQGRLTRAIQTFGGGSSEEFRFLREFLDRPHTIATGSRINSGFQLVGRKFLTGDFADELIATASSSDFPNEQAVLTEYFRRHAGAGHAFRSPAYNFKAPSLVPLSRTESAILLPEIANLHFLGRAKPWRTQKLRNLDVPAALWWRHAETLSPHADLFSAENFAALSGQIGASATWRSSPADAAPGPALPPDRGATRASRREAAGNPDQSGRNEYRDDGD